MAWNKRQIGFWFFMACLGVLYLVLRYLFNDFSLKHPTFQLQVSRLLLLTLLFYLTRRYWLDPKILNRAENPYSLVALRMAVFAGPAWFAIQPFHELSDTLLRQWIDLPVSDRVPLPFLEYYSLHVPVSRAIISFIQPVFLLVSVTAFLGLFTRASVIIYSLLALYIYSICQLYGKPVNNHYLVWFPIVLACSNCGQVFSFDALINRYRTGQPSDDRRSNQYTSPINAGVILLGVLYFFPGFWKIWTCGLDWIFRYNLRNIFYGKWIELNGWVPSFRIDETDLLVAAVSIGAVLFELVFIFWALARQHSWLLLVAGILFHGGVLYFMQIDFTFLLPLYVCLFDWGNVADYFKNKRQRGKPGMLTITGNAFSLANLCLIALVGGNILFGFTKTVSWPLACFPTFDYMVPDSKAVVYYAGYRGTEQAVPDSLFRTQLNNTLSSYNVAARENRILDFYSQNNFILARQTAQALLAAVMDSIPADSVMVYKVYRPIKPQATRQLINKELITVVKLPAKK